MPSYVSDGQCNMCGECCGAPTALIPTSPWPTFPFTARDWEYAIFASVFRFAAYVGILESVDGVLEWEPAWQITIPSIGTVYGCFVPEVPWIGWSGICTNLPPYDDVTISSPKCPFLVDGPAPYTCAVNRPQFSDEWEAMCGWRYQEDVFTELQKIKFEADHPSCSLTWTEV